MLELGQRTQLTEERRVPSPTDGHSERISGAETGSVYRSTRLFVAESVVRAVVHCESTFSAGSGVSFATIGTPRNEPKSC